MHTHHSHNPADMQEAIALLKYMANHNVSHANELKKLIPMLEHNLNASSLIEQAVADYEKGNDALFKALELLEEE